MRTTGKSTMQLRVIVLFLDQNTKARKQLMVNGLVIAAGHKQKGRTSFDRIATLTGGSRVHDVP